MLIQSPVGDKRAWSEGRAASEVLQPTLTALPDDVWYSIVNQIVAHLGTDAALSVRAPPSTQSPPAPHSARALLLKLGSARRARRVRGPLMRSLSRAPP